MDKVRRFFGVPTSHEKYRTGAEQEIDRRVSRPSAGPSHRSGVQRPARPATRSTYAPRSRQRDADPVLYGGADHYGYGDEGGRHAASESPTSSPTHHSSDAGSGGGGFSSSGGGGGGFSGGGGSGGDSGGGGGGGGGGE